MTTRDRDTRMEGLGPGPAGEATTEQAPRSEDARELMEAAFAAVSASVVDKVLTQDHASFLSSVRQSGGQ